MADDAKVTAQAKAKLVQDALMERCPDVKHTHGYWMGELFYGFSMESETAQVRVALRRGALEVLSVDEIIAKLESEGGLLEKLAGPTNYALTVHEDHVKIEEVWKKKSRPQTDNAS